MLQKIVFSSYSLSLVVVTFLRAKVHYYFETCKKIGEKVLEKVTVKGVVCVDKGKWIRKLHPFTGDFFLSSSVPQFLSFVLGGILDGCNWLQIVSNYILLYIYNIYNKLLNKDKSEGSEKN